MKMHPSRRRGLSLLAGTLFAVNALGLFFGFRSVFTPAFDISSTQFAASAGAESATSSPEAAR